MKPEVIIPTDEKHWLSLRAMDLTSTDIAALFGCSPYLTHFELWHRKKNNMDSDFKENERADWGNYLEAAIANKFAEENGWKIRPMKEYIRMPEHRLGSSFDFSIEDGPLSEHGILEIKNVDSLVAREKWIVDGDDVEAPPHIELQIQHQLLVAQRALGYIGACVGGNKGILIKRPANQKIQDAIMKQARFFWYSIDRNDEPEPNLERDAQFIADLHSYAEPGKVVDAAAFPGLDDIMRQYAAFQEQESRAAKQKEACKAQALMLINDAEKVIAPDWSISAGLIGPKLIESYTRAGYRNFRMNKKKIKEEANAATNIAS